MKNSLENNKLVEIHPPLSQQPSTYVDNDEISLVDLALVLLHRKMLIAIILGLSIIAGITTSMLISDRLDYTTTIKIGTQIIDNEVEPLETPETLLVKINHIFIPQTLNEFQKPYSISASNPKKSDIILLQTSALDLEDKTPIEVLTSLARKIELDQNKIYTSIKNNLETDLKPVSIKAFAAQTASLQKTYTVSEPIASGPGSKFSTKVILITSLFAGLFLGIFAAFFAEFWAKVKEAQRTHR